MVIQDRQSCTRNLDTTTLETSLGMTLCSESLSDESKLCRDGAADLRHADIKFPSQVLQNCMLLHVWVFWGQEVLNSIDDMTERHLQQHSCRSVSGYFLRNNNQIRKP